MGNDYIMKGIFVLGCLTVTFGLGHKIGADRAFNSGRETGLVDAFVVRKFQETYKPTLANTKHYDNMQEAYVFGSIDTSNQDNLEKLQELAEEGKAVRASLTDKLP